MAVKRQIGWTFNYVEHTTGNVRQCLGDSLTITENGWVKIWLRKKLVGVITNWRSVTVAADALRETPRT